MRRSSLAAGSVGGSRMGAVRIRQRRRCSCHPTKGRGIRRKADTAAGARGAIRHGGGGGAQSPVAAAAPHRLAAAAAASMRTRCQLPCGASLHRSSAVTPSAPACYPRGRLLW
eukprot:353947-Chlamydomonas_euryale.AAC.4